MKALMVVVLIHRGLICPDLMCSSRSIASLSFRSDSAAWIASAAALEASAARAFNLAISSRRAASTVLLNGLATKSVANSPATPIATSSAAAVLARLIHESQNKAPSNSDFDIWSYPDHKNDRLDSVVIGLAAIWLILRTRRGL
jgi:hypothetical protein